MLDQYGDDNEWDINGQMEKELLEMNEKMFVMTGGKQKYKFDYRKDGKLDISFVRLYKRGTPYKGWGMDYPLYFAQKKGFNNPKKLYYSWVDFRHPDGGQMGVHSGYTFLLIKFSISSPVNVSYVKSAFANLCKSSIFSVRTFFALSYP